MFWAKLHNYVRIVNDYRNVDIVFYSEGSHHSEHLFPIVKELIKRKKILYVTSDDRDAVLCEKHHNLTSFFIGTGVFRLLFFKNISCKIFITSLPDLNKFSFKKSKNCAYYIYIHHSIVSCHMAYRESAFDEFNEVFCVGPHHMHELEKQERLLGSPKKTLTPHGNSKIDMLFLTQDIDVMKNTILIAPSWGTSGLFEKHIDEIIKICKNNERYTYILRPHSETMRKNKYVDKMLNTINIPNIIYDKSASKDWFLKSEIMISDWSGAAYEFIFGLQRPVIFVETPRKINNDQYTVLGIEPFEILNRDKFGIIVSFEELYHMPFLIDRAKAVTFDLSKNRDHYIYNVGYSSFSAAYTIFQRINYKAEDIREKLKKIHDQFYMKRSMRFKDTIFIVEKAIFQIKENNFEEKFIVELLKKIDVSKKLYDTYNVSWKKTDNAKKLNKEEIMIICFYLLNALEDFMSKNKALAFKISNSLLNICEFNENIKEECFDYFKKIISSKLF